jgi:glycosyltransferase involved in cell wall biosynthesis
MYRIGMIAPMPFLEDRGCPIRVYGESKGLLGLGHKVEILSYHLGREVPENIKIHRIPRIPWYNRIEAGASYHKIYLDALLLLKSFQTIKQKNYDILHTHLHEGAAIAQFLNIVKINKPIIFDAQGSLIGEMLAHEFLNPDSLMVRLWKAVERKIYHGSGIILASSQHLIEMIETEFDVSKDKIVFIPDGVDIVFFNPDRYNKKELRRKYNLENNLNIVVFTGLFSKYQGLDFLIEEVIPKVVKESSNTKFLLVGYPESRYKKLSKQLGLDKHIIFTGKQNFSKIPEFLGLADIAITPKVMKMGEANLKILSYMAMGLPTVSFDYFYNKEMVKDSGLTTKVNDSEEFSKAILSLLCDQNQKEIMGQRAKIIAQKEYSWISTAKKIVEAYNKVI